MTRDPFATGPTSGGGGAIARDMVTLTYSLDSIWQIGCTR